MSTVSASSWWRDEICAAASTTPSEPQPNIEIKSQRSHWLYSLRALDGEIEPGAGAEQIGGVYLQSRRSGVPRALPSNSDAFAVLRAMAWVRESSLDQYGREWQSRLAPSAGGTHAISPLLYHRGSWYVDREAGLIEVLVEENLANDLLGDVKMAGRIDDAQSVLFGVAEISLLDQRYRNGASLLWRDAGAFLAIAQLVAISRGVESTILGIAKLLPYSTADPGAAIVGAVLMGSGEV